MFNLYMNLYTHASWPHLHTLTHSHSSRLHSQATSQTVTHAYTLSYACGPHEHRHIHMHTHTCIHSHTECTKRTHTHSITHSYTSDRHQPLHRKQLHTTHYLSVSQTLSHLDRDHRFSCRFWFSSCNQHWIGLIGSKELQHDTVFEFTLNSLHDIASLHFIRSSLHTMPLRLLSVVYILNHKIELIVSIHSSDHHSLSHSTLTLIYSLIFTIIHFITQKKNHRNQFWWEKEDIHTHCLLWFLL